MDVAKRDGMQNKVSILYLRTDITNEKLIAGGSVAHTLGVINGFTALGHTVVCASSIMLDLLRKCDGVAVHELRNPSWLKVLRLRLNCVLSTIFFLKQALTLFASNNFDYIYQRYSIFNTTGALLSRIKKVPLILEYNGSEVWVDKNWTGGGWLRMRWLIGWIEKINLRCAHTIVVVSQPLKDELISRGITAGKILVNPNGVDTHALDPAKLSDERTQIRVQYALKDKFVFGFVGTFGAWHGIEVLATMIPKVIAQQPQAHFLLIGDGPRKAWLEEQLFSFSEHVTFTGLVPQHEAKNYLAACDAFLSPTQPNPDGTPFFGSPAKLFEYMSMAKPIIVSDIGQLAEVIRPAVRADEAVAVSDQVGIVVPPTEHDMFVRAAVHLVDTPLHQLGSNARVKVCSQYQWRQHVKTIFNFAQGR